MNIVDTHCHYNLEPLYSGQPAHFSLDEDSPLRKLSWQDHWQQAHQQGVAGAVVVGTTPETSQKAVEIAQLQLTLKASLGVHPHFSPESSLENTETLFETLLHNHSDQIVALGETGLDYFRLDRQSSQFSRIVEKQKEAFLLHLRLAQKYRLPLIIHCRDDQEQAYWETLEILQQHQFSGMKFVLHCASGPVAYIQEAIALGGYVGFDGNSTYKNADSVRKLILATPPERLLLETDAPYLPPAAHRGKICEPWMIVETARYAQDVLQLSLEQIFDNTQQFFQTAWSKIGEPVL